MPPSQCYSERRRRWTIIILTAITAIAAVFYFIFDPATSRFMPQCVFHRLTGLDCPGCGMQRMLHALLHADFVEAWHANAFLLCSLPVISVLVVLDMCRTRAPRLYAAANSPAAIAIYALAIIAWSIARNL